MTRFPSGRYDAQQGGLVISVTSGSDADQQSYDFARLERVVLALVEEHRRLQRENGALRDEVRQNGIALRTLEGQLLEANQKRQDVAKRIDELIAQIDQLDQQFANADS